VRVGRLEARARGAREEASGVSRCGPLEGGSSARPELVAVWIGRADRFGDRAGIVAALHGEAGLVGAGEEVERGDGVDVLVALGAEAEALWILRAREAEERDVGGEGAEGARR
jgi:hypothetical protein